MTIAKLLPACMSCALLSVPALADIMYVDESGPEGSPPVVTLSNTTGSSFLKSASATAFTCPGDVVLNNNCWNIDVVVQGTYLVSWGSFGVELFDPGTGALSDGFSTVSLVPNNPLDTSDLTFQLLSDPSNPTSGRAYACALGLCGAAVETGALQAATVGLTVGDSTDGIHTTDRTFDVYLKSVDSVPEPSAIVLLGMALCALALLGRRKRQQCRPQTPKGAEASIKVAGDFVTALVTSDFSRGQVVE